MLRGFILIAACLGVVGCEDQQDGRVAGSAIIGDSISEALGGMTGNAQRGLEIFTRRELGHCVLCHRVSGLDTPFQGNAGPDLTSVGTRLDAGQVRLRIVDYQRVVPGALMPSYHRTHGLYQVAEEYRGEPILSAQQVEDLVAYLSSLKE